MNGKNQVKLFENVDAVRKGFTGYIQQLLADATGNFNMALSGGSTPKALFNYWSDHPEIVDWKQVRFFWGDERCVPPDDDESNFGMTKALLFNHLPITDKQIFRIKGEADPNSEAQRYSQVLASELLLKDGLPVFDLIILGMGDDGHTASIFPHEFELWQNPKHCVVATHPTSGQKRISITGQIIKNAKQVAFLTTGSGKAEMLQTIFENPIQASKSYPAAKVMVENPNTYWFLDDAAAKWIV